MENYEMRQSMVDGEPVAVINGTTDDEWICADARMLMNTGDCA